MEFWVEIIEFECSRSCVYIPYCISLKSQGIKDVNFDRILGFQSLYWAQPEITVDPRMSFSDTVASRVGAYRFEFFEVRVLILIELRYHQKNGMPKFQVYGIQCDLFSKLRSHLRFRIFLLMFSYFGCFVFVGVEPSSKGKALEEA